MENNWPSLESACGVSIARDVSLRRYSSLGIGGYAAGAVTAENEKILEKIIPPAVTLGIPVKILGGGTNVVFTDAGFSGLLIRLGEGFKKIEVESPRVRAGAAVHLPSLITRTMESGLAGVEKLAGIPGTLGGAIYQNSGARDYEIGRAVSAVTIWDIDHRKTRTMKKNEIEFGYRTSCFKKIRAVILSADLELQPASRESLMSEVSARMKYRGATQPTGRSIGCIFRNAEGRSAGQLIDQAGLKGRRVGGLVISDMHGNFFLNDGQATFKDFEELVALAQSEVQKKFGILLELEVEIVRENPTSANTEGKSNPGSQGSVVSREGVESRPPRRWKISGEGNFI